MFLKGGAASPWQFSSGDFDFYLSQYVAGSDWIAGTAGTDWWHNTISKTSNIIGIKNEDLSLYGAIGLDVDNTQAYIITKCDFSIIRGGVQTIREKGTIKYTHGTQTNKMRIEKDGNTPKYYINDVLVYSSLGSQANSYGWFGVYQLNNTITAPRILI